MDLSWDAYLARHDELRHAAVRSAAALRGGDRSPVLEDFAGFAWLSVPDLAEPVFADLLGAEVQPAPAHVSAAHLPAQSLPAVPWAAEPCAPQLHRERLADLTLHTVDRDPLAWALHALAELGCWAQRGRQAWRAPSAAPDPARDDAAAALWTAWFATGAPWGQRDVFEALYLPHVDRVVRLSARARELDGGVVRQAVEDARSAFFLMMLGDDGEIPGYRVLAALAVEGAPPAPLAATLGASPTPLRQAVARCAVTRGTRARSARHLHPMAHGAEGRMQALSDLLAPDPTTADAWVEAHLVLHLLHAWRSGRFTHPRSIRAVAAQARARARARARAALAEHAPRALGAAVAALDAPYARTARAVRQVAAGWAWEALRQPSGHAEGGPESGIGHPFASGYSLSVQDPGMAPPAPRFDTPVVLLSRCDLPLDGASLSEDAGPVLDTWVLYAALRGHLNRLLAWVRDGRGDADTRWGKFLAQDTPAALIADPTAVRRARYHALRQALLDTLDERLSLAIPVLRQVSAVAGGRRTKAQITEVLQPVWNAVVPFPAGGFPRMPARAADALARLRADGVDWEPEP
ncbi:MAG: hypothetical protein ACI8PZ_001331 [Myxococcota bacterium]|jgi:hypothetical protein